MNDPQPDPVRVSTARCFEITERGIVAPDDRVELLDGLIVSMSAQSRADENLPPPSVGA